MNTHNKRKKNVRTFYGKHLQEIKIHTHTFLLMLEAFYVRKDNLLDKALYISLISFHFCLFHTQRQGEVFKATKPANILDIAMLLMLYGFITYLPNTEANAFVDCDVVHYIVRILCYL